MKRARIILIGVVGGEPRVIGLLGLLLSIGSVFGGGVRPCGEPLVVGGVLLLLTLRGLLLLLLLGIRRCVI